MSSSASSSASIPLVNTSTTPSTTEQPSSQLPPPNLRVLDPEWLDQYPSQRQEDAFFWDVLPVLVMRVGDIKPDWKLDIPGTIALPNDTWSSMFQDTNFDIDRAIITFNDKPLDCLKNLTQVVLLRAKVMYEKLWKHCAEFCLLGLAYYRMKNSRRTSSGSVSQRQLDRMQALCESQELSTNKELDSPTRRYFRAYADNIIQEGQ